MRYLDRNYHPTTEATIRAVQELGHPWVDDHNRPGAVGVGRMPMNTLDGRRVTTLDAYLADIPASLEIRADSLVDRVLFDGTSVRGVRLADGTEIPAAAVVLSAGVYGSPPILLRSGVGPQGQVVDLPEWVRILPTTQACSSTSGIAARGRPGAPCHRHLPQFGHADRPGAGPHVLDPGSGRGTGGVRHRGPADEAPVRGSVRLRSADPHDAPLIRLPNLEDPADVPRLMEGYRQALRVAKLPQPGDAELEATIRAEAYRSPTSSALALSVRSWTPKATSTAQISCGWWTPRSSPTPSPVSPTSPP